MKMRPPCSSSSRRAEYGRELPEPPGLERQCPCLPVAGKWPSPVRIRLDRHFFVSRSYQSNQRADCHSLARRRGSSAGCQLKKTQPGC